MPLKTIIPSEHVPSVAALDRDEVGRLTALIRRFSKIPKEHRNKRIARMLDYWRHARGYLRWRVAHFTHPGKAKPKS